MSDGGDDAFSTLLGIILLAVLGYAAYSSLLEYRNQIEFEQQNGGTSQAPQVNLESTLVR